MLEVRLLLHRYHTRINPILLCCLGADDVRIAPTDAARYQLPFVVAANTSLLIASGDLAGIRQAKHSRYAAARGPVTRSGGSTQRGHG